MFAQESTKSLRQVRIPKMKISIWDIFRYILKWKLLIVLAVVGCAALSVWYTNRGQSYEAQVVIRYNDDCIKEGRNPKNESFDSYEIVSPDVISAVISDLSLTRSVDAIRSRVRVNAIIPESEKTMEESKLKEGEKYVYHPTSFYVTYSGRVGESEKQVHDILDSIVKNYLRAYVSNYIGQMTVNDLAFDDKIGNADYIEIAESISTRIDSTVTSLGNYYSKDTSFRSSRTGLSFSDIKDEYTHLQDFLLSKVYADIFRGQRTKDRDLLLKKYTQKLEDDLLSESNFRERAQAAKERTDVFAKANIDVLKAYERATDNKDTGDVIQSVYDFYRYNDSSSGSRNVITTYDSLMQEYVKNETAANNARFSAENCRMIISKFADPALTDGMAEKEELTGEVERSIEYIQNKTNEIYKKLSITVEDFNDADAITHISILTGVKYYAAKSLSVYALIFMMIGLMLSVLFAITYELIKVYRKNDDEKCVMKNE